MGVISQRTARRRSSRRRVVSPRANDPRVVRSRAAVVEAARELFLRKGYAGTTMDEIAAAAGLTKRTLYNNYADKGALFTRVVTEVMAYAETFARGLHEELTAGVTAANLPARLDDLARRQALGIMRPEVIALRRLLIRESREFPAFGAKYFERAPGLVLNALASGFDRLGRLGLLQMADSRLAAAQFAYLVVGEPLDRAMLVGTVPPKEHVIACASEGVRTFLARYQRARGRAGAAETPRS
jgi:TetR/AcrR family transcriptional repressor of mexJK operon